jgi:uncharacterized membrane protein
MPGSRIDEPSARQGEPHRRGERGEALAPPVVAVVVAAGLYALLPESLLLGPRLLVPAVEVVLLVALVITNPRRLTRQTRLSRSASLALASVVVVTNLVALGILLAELPSPQAGQPGPLLLAALQVWATNVIGFGLIYWELDRGGPVSRARCARADLPQADWRFSQDENDDTVTEVSAGSSARSGWIPHLVDYLYLSVTNSSAFSPTDTMPLTTRAKALMSVQATAALLTSLLIIARAVGAIR